MYCWHAIQSLGDFGYDGLLADLATDWMYYWHDIQSLGDFGYDGTVANLATDWMDCRHAIQGLGDFGYMFFFSPRTISLDRKYE